MPDKPSGRTARASMTSSPKKLLLLLPLLLLAGLAIVFAIWGRPLTLALIDWVLASESLALERSRLEIDLFGGSVLTEDLVLVDLDTGSPLVAVNRAQGAFGLLDLVTMDLAEASLFAEHVSVYLPAAEDEALQGEAWTPTEQVEWLEYRNWLPGTVDGALVELFPDSDSTVPLLRFTDVRGRKGSRPGSLDIETRMDYLGTGMLVAASFDSMQRIGGDLYGIDMQAGVTVESSGALVALSGSLREEGGGPWYEGEMSVEDLAAPDLISLLELDYPLEGMLAIEAGARGDFEGIALRGVKLVLDNAPGYEFLGEGNIDYQFAGGGRLALHLSTQLGDLQDLLESSELNFGELASATADMQVRGSFDDLLVEDIAFSLQGTEGLALGVAGAIRINSFNAREFLTEEGLSLTMSAPGLSSLQSWTGDLGIEPGPWQAEARVRQVENHLHVGDIRMSADDGAGLSLSARGEIGRLGNLDTGDFAIVEDIALSVKLDSATSARLTGPFAPGVPELGALALEAVAAGSAERLQVRAVNGTLRSAGRYRLSFSDGRIDISPASDTPASNLQLGLLLELLSATQQDAGKMASSLSVAAVAPLELLLLSIELDHVSTSRLTQLLNENFDYQDQSGFLTGRFTLSGSGESFALRDIDIHNTGNEQVQFSVQGAINNLSALNDIDLSATVDISDRQFLHELVGRPLNPWHSELRIQGRDSAVDVSSDNRFGESDLNVGLHMDFDEGSPAGLRVNVSSPELRLVDVGLVGIARREEQPAKTVQPAPGEDADGKPWDNIPDIPMELRMNVERLVGERFDAEALRLEVTAADGVYTVRRLDLDHTGGSTRMRASLDTSEEPPRWLLQGSALDLQLAALIADLGVDSDLSGSFNTAVDLNALGEDRGQIIANLDGSVTLVLEDLTIKGAAYDVLATETVAWFYSGAALEDKTVFTCIMGDFVVTSGVATTEEFFVESDRMMALGPVELDLNQQTVLAEITPRSKDRAIQIPGKIRVAGPFDNPGVSSPALAHGVDATAEVATFVPRFALKSFDTVTGFFKGDRRKEDVSLTRCQQVAPPQG